MISHNSPTKLWNIAFEINKVLALFESNNIIKMNIFISPFKIVNNSFISQFFLYNEYILEKLNNSLTNIQMIKLSNHGFLILQILFICVNQSISLINYRSDIIKYLRIHIALVQSVQHGLVFTFFSL